MSNWRHTAPRIEIDGVTWIAVRWIHSPDSPARLYRYEGLGYTLAGERIIASLADEYPTHSPLWQWLRAHGIARPSRSGPSDTTQPNAERRRKVVPVSLSDVARARLDELAYRYGSRSAAVEALVLAAL